MPSRLLELAGGTQVIVLTMGTFDLFHAGHVNILNRCRAIASEDDRQGGSVVVGLNTDEFVAAYKGRLPVVAYADREAVVKACRYVDAVLPNAQPDGTVRGLVAAVRPRVIVVGSDWQERDYLGQIGLNDWDLTDRGIRIVYAPYTEGISTTTIRERVGA